jgi:hypothetical protein
MELNRPRLLHAPATVWYCLWRWRLVLLWQQYLLFTFLYFFSDELKKILTVHLARGVSAPTVPVYYVLERVLWPPVRWCLGGRICMIASGPDLWSLNWRCRENGQTWTVTTTTVYIRLNRSWTDKTSPSVPPVVSRHVQFGYWSSALWPM